MIQVGSGSDSSSGNSRSDVVSGSSSESIENSMRSIEFSMDIIEFSMRSIELSMGTYTYTYKYKYKYLFLGQGEPSSARCVNKTKKQLSLLLGVRERLRRAQRLHELRLPAREPHENPVQLC